MNDMKDTNGQENNAAAVRTAGGTGLQAVGWIAAVLSLFIYPLIFGTLGVVLGIVTAKSRRRAGIALTAASIVLMGIGLIWSGVILNYTRHYLGI